MVKLNFDKFKKSIPLFPSSSPSPSYPSPFPAAATAATAVGSLIPQHHKNVSSLLNQIHAKLKEREHPLIIGIAGGSGSGKTTLAKNIAQLLNHKHVSYISHDSYYKDLGNMSLCDRAKVNFDHPNALETSLLAFHLSKLKNNNPVDIPTYDFSTHSRCLESERIFPQKIILVDGILLLFYRQLFNLFDLRIFVHAQDSIRLERRIERDVKERGRSRDSVINQYHQTVLPMHRAFVEPTKHSAHLVVSTNFEQYAANTEKCLFGLLRMLHR